MDLSDVRSTGTAGRLEGSASGVLSTVVSTASELGLSFPTCLRGRYTEDAYFRKIAADPAAFPLFQYTDGLLYKQEGDSCLLCVPDVLLGPRKAREILIRHAHSLLAHLGSRKTLDYLRGELWW
ncbi:hypothetical protein K466DRAFT_506499, partial [Polyporus arcularius HHB13444]